MNKSAKLENIAKIKKKIAKIGKKLKKLIYKKKLTKLKIASLKNA